MALGLLFVIQGIVFGELIAANRERDRRVQASRIYSCRQTYSKVQQVLRASVAGRHLNTERQNRLNGLLELVNPSQCDQQTGASR